VRQELNNHDFKTLFTVVKERHYTNTEIQELADIAYRNLTLAQGFAMDPLIEKCIIGKYFSNSYFYFRYIRVPSTSSRVCILIAI
jgi:hypothetical protein